MAKLTMEQAKKWNAQLKNGYRLDIQRYVVWNEKTASLKIDIGGDKILEGSLSYVEERDGYRYTGRKLPRLHLRIWNVDRETGVGTSHGLGAYVNAGEPQDKRNWKYLCELSGLFPAERVKDLAAEHADLLGAETLTEWLAAAG